MINEDKLKLMTSIALFEKREGRHLKAARNYFRSDYISRCLLRSFIGYTLCWLMVAALSIVCRAEDFLAILSLAEMESYITEYAAGYLIGLAVYMILTLIVSYKQYSHSARVMRIYLARLKRLEKRYEFQQRVKELSKEGKRS